METNDEKLEEKVEAASEQAAEWLQAAMDELWNDYEEQVKPKEHKDFSTLYFNTVDFIFLRLCTLLYTIHVSNPSLAEAYQTAPVPVKKVHDKMSETVRKNTLPNGKDHDDE